MDPVTGNLLEYRDLIKGPEAERWKLGNIKEIGRLTDGRVGGDDVIGTNTIFFIHPSQLPKGRKATYLRVCADYRPQKADPYQIRWTVGGDKLDYPGIVSTPTAELTTVKLHLNSTISDPQAKYLILDIKDFYLNTPMSRYEYMWVPVTMLPPEVMDAYKLHDLVHNGKVLVEIRKGMYGLSQAGRIAYDNLVKNLAPHGYHPCKRTAGLWKHESRPTTFTLVVDDFGIKFNAMKDAHHLIDAIKSNYKCTIDWAGSLYCGITLDWDYEKGTVELSMPGYVPQALQRFQHPPPTKPQKAPSKYTAPTYGTTGPQYNKAEDTTAPLDAEGTLRVQQVSGTFLFYSRAVDPTMREALSSISSQQSKPTRATMDEINHLLDYAASNPDATIQYKRSDMHLHVHSDASFAAEPGCKSRAGGHHYMSEKPKPNPKPTDPDPPNNGPVNTVCRIMKHVLGSAAEAELGAAFENCGEACAERLALEEMGHPQGPTPITVDNSTAYGIANKTVKQRRSRTMDLRFYWIQDRVEQKQFQILWKQGKRNLGDYFTKRHPTKHHIAMRHVYLKTQRKLDDAHATIMSNLAKRLRGCADHAGPRPRIT